MSIKHTLATIANIAEKYQLYKPYIVGGLPRDIYLKSKIKTTDIDLTTNHSDVLRLGILTSSFYNSTFELADDKHITVFLDSFDIDFSSNFISESVLKILDDKQKEYAEAYSRDFTINTLHQDLKTFKFYDFTGSAIQDLDSKIIRTPVDPSITLTDDPRRIYRAINLAAKYNFKIDDSIINFAKENKDLFSEKVKDKYIILKISDALSQNQELTLKLLLELGLLNSVPLFEKFKDALISTKLLSNYLENDVQSNLVKDALKKPQNWEEYASQGRAYQKLSDWWKQNYYKFPNHDSPDYFSWVSWYNNKYNNDWGHQHKSPEETLNIMIEESKGIQQTLPEFKSGPVKLIRPQQYELTSNDYLSKVKYSKTADLINISDVTKKFISYIGLAASKQNIQTPYITSGYRSIKEQAMLMIRNWKTNGALHGGREYLEKLYGKDYGGSIADIIEKYGVGREAIEKAILIVNKFGSQHTKSPGQAIDFRNTPGIKELIEQAKSEFNIKVIDETNTANPHIHVSVYGIIKTSNYQYRKERLKIIANN